MAPPHDEYERDPASPPGDNGSHNGSHNGTRNGHRMDRFSAGWPPTDVDVDASLVLARPRTAFDAATTSPSSSREALRHLPPDYRDRPYLTVGDVAVLLGVTTQTVRNWSDAGRLDPIRTPGGHRRFPTLEVARLMGEVIGT